MEQMQYYIINTNNNNMRMNLKIPFNQHVFSKEEFFKVEEECFHLCYKDEKKKLLNSKNKNVNKKKNSLLKSTWLGFVHPDVASLLNEDTHIIPTSSVSSTLIQHYDPTRLLNILKHKRDLLESSESILILLKDGLSHLTPSSSSSIIITDDVSSNISQQGHHSLEPVEDVFEPDFSLLVPIQSTLEEILRFNKTLKKNVKIIDDMLHETQNQLHHTHDIIMTTDTSNNNDLQETYMLRQELFEMSLKRRRCILKLQLSIKPALPIIENIRSQYNTYCCRKRSPGGMLYHELEYPFFWDFFCQNRHDIHNHEENDTHLSIMHINDSNLHSYNIVLHSTLYKEFINLKMDYLKTQNIPADKILDYLNKIEILDSNLKEAQDMETQKLNEAANALFSFACSFIEKQEKQRRSSFKSIIGTPNSLLRSKVAIQKLNNHDMVMPEPIQLTEEMINNLDCNIKKLSTLMKEIVDLTSIEQTTALEEEKTRHQAKQLLVQYKQKLISSSIVNELENNTIDIDDDYWNGIPSEEFRCTTEANNNQSNCFYSQLGNCIRNDCETVVVPYSDMPVNILEDHVNLSTTPFSLLEFKENNHNISNDTKNQDRIENKNPQDIQQKINEFEHNDDDDSIDLLN